MPGGGLPPAQHDRRQMGHPGGAVGGNAQQQTPFLPTRRWAACRPIGAEGWCGTGRSPDSRWRAPGPGPKPCPDGGCGASRRHRGRRHRRARCRPRWRPRPGPPGAVMASWSCWPSRPTKSPRHLARARLKPAGLPDQGGARTRCSRGSAARRGLRALGTQAPGDDEKFHAGGAAIEDRVDQRPQPSRVWAVQQHDERDERCCCAPPPPAAVLCGVF